MTANASRDRSSLRNVSPLLLMGGLFVALLIAPILETKLHSRAVVYAGVTLVLILGTFVSSRRQVLFVPSLILALLAIATTWTTLIFDNQSLFVVSCLLGAAFYALVASILLIIVLKRHVNSVQSVFGAVCVYLLLGLSWAALYWAALRMNGSAFHSPPRVIEGDPFAEGEEAFRPFSDMVYFSFVTMSTLGYGDMYPQTSLAKTLTWMQSVLGQFYLAALVAWIVNSIRLWSPTEAAERPVDSS